MLPLVLGAALAVAQGVALVALVARLAPGRRRARAVEPDDDAQAIPLSDTSVTVIVATLNEARRLGPCLDGLRAQCEPMLELLVVDSRSTDGTRELVAAEMRRDSRVRLLTDPPLPSGWVGKVWALESGLHEARGEWVLGIDADTIPKPGMISAVVRAAREHELDVVSFGPRFVGQSAAERWLQPAMLVTLVYRTGAAGAVVQRPERVMANGQCFLARRDVLERHGGYAPARASFSDDVTLARYLAARGARVGFLDGSRIIDVHAYSSAREMWREWGRSFDLKDASTPARQWRDVLLVLFAQGAPLLVLAALTSLHIVGWAPHTASGALVWRVLRDLNLALVAVRLLLLVPLAGSYARTGAPFWLSPLADPLAALRLLMSTLRTPSGWRGRSYERLHAE
jgi:dolichol-phosphate mannosyltransferase